MRALICLVVLLVANAGAVFGIEKIVEPLKEGWKSATSFLSLFPFLFFLSDHFPLPSLTTSLARVSWCGH